MQTNIGQTCICADKVKYLSLFHINNITTPSINAHPRIFTISMLTEGKKTYM
jgi:hypothetical protein